MGVRIAGTGSYVPEQILTNADLEKMVDTSDEWIRTRTGISQRHLASPEQSTSTLAHLACERALQAAGVSGTEVNAIIVATSTPDYVFPSTAAILQEKFASAQCFCFDLSAACCGFISAMEVAVNLLNSQPKYRYALVCGAEKLSSIVDWSDRTTCVLFGDGAGAVLLANDDDAAGSTLLASDLNADGRFNQVLRIPSSGSACPVSPEALEQHWNYIHMRGQETFKLAVNSMVDACRKVADAANVSITEDVKLVIPHQANARIIQAVAKRLELREEQVLINIDKYGNTSAASIPICLDEAVRAGRLHRGELVLFTSFGSGLAWGAQLFRY